MINERSLMKHIISTKELTTILLEHKMERNPRGPPPDTKDRAQDEKNRNISADIWLV
jgi:hypothetical protein